MNNHASFRDAVLPPAFSIGEHDSLIRLGRDHDGGYLVCLADVVQAKGLISLGLDSDWSFEQDFAARNACPIHAYDANSNRGRFVAAFAVSLLNPLLLHRIWAQWRRLSSHKRLFRGNRRQIGQFVGIQDGALHIGFEQVLDDAPDGPLFLKIDIEGGEYRLLGDLVTLAPRITGLVIEFHDCDLNLDRIVTFLHRFELPLVHVHANNWSPITADGLPLVLELTFSRNAVATGKAANLPHRLDKPNNPKQPEIVLHIETGAGRNDGA